MKRIFLSLGFSNRSEYDILNDIELAKKIIIKYIGNEQEYEFIHNYYYHGDNRIECLGQAIRNMSTCDAVFFIGNWYKHNGCLVEQKVCELYNIDHYLVDLHNEVVSKF